MANIEYTQRYNGNWFPTATPVNAVKANVTLTIDTQVLADDTMTIGGKLYTFVADGAESSDGDISVGTDLATCQANIVAAINGTDSINTANEYVVAGNFATNDSVITALVVGTEQNSVAVSETFDEATNIFSGTNLSGGQYATPVGTASFWISSGGVWYIANSGVNKWDESGWKSATPS